VTTHTLRLTCLCRWWCLTSGCSRRGEVFIRMTLHLPTRFFLNRTQPSGLFVARFVALCRVTRNSPMVRFLHRRFFRFYAASPFSFLGSNCRFRNYCLLVHRWIFLWAVRPHGPNKVKNSCAFSPFFVVLVRCFSNISVGASLLPHSSSFFA